MPISNLTALIIATRDDIVAAAGGPDANGKYMAWITLGEQDRYRPLLNTEAIYDSKEDAEQWAREFINDIRATVDKRIEAAT